MIALLALAATATLSCPAEAGRYVLRDAPYITADFRPVDSGEDWPSRLAIVVRNRRTGSVSWWLPWPGGTDNLQNIASTMDIDAPGWRPPDPDDGPRPYGDRQYLEADADYNVIDDIPDRGRPAPAHFLIPNAGDAHDGVFPTKSFFDLVGCSRPGG